MCSNTDALYQDRQRPILGALPKDALQCPWGLPTSAATLEYKLYQDIKNKQNILNTKYSYKYKYKVHLQIHIQNTVTNTKYKIQFQILKQDTMPLRSSQHWQPNYTWRIHVTCNLLQLNTW